MSAEDWGAEETAEEMPVEVEPLRLGVGIHDISFAQYLADPCEEPSLRSGDIQRLLITTPRHFIANHPRLAPNPPRMNSARMDLGSIVHKMVLGEGDDVTLCDFKDWRTQKARDERDEARANGCIPALPKTFNEALIIARSAIEVLGDEFGEWPFGQVEKTFIWSERIRTRGGDEQTIWCRVRPDIWCEKRALAVDLKSTEIVLSDDGVEGRLTEDDGRTLIQAAWQVRGATALHPELAGRITHCNVFVETKAPFLARVNDTPLPELEIFNRRCTQAMERFVAVMDRPVAKQQGWPRKGLGARSWLINKYIDEEGGIEA